MLLQIQSERETVEYITRVKPLVLLLNAYLDLMLFQGKLEQTWKT